jgi:hypothetical protein
MRFFVLAVLTLMIGTSLASAQSPYAGDELRPLKSLSAKEVESLRTGQGMGFAKLAELNHYPGPKHVLKLADELDLSAAQVAETEGLFQEMRHNAIALGEQLLAAEMELDRHFQEESIRPKSLQSALLAIGKLRAQLRYVHLEAHLRQRSLLTAEQIARYDELRGYRGAAQDHQGHSKSHK